MKSSFHKILLALLLTPLSALAEWGLNMTQGVTPISKEIYSMHMVSLWVVTVIGIVVFSIMFFNKRFFKREVSYIFAKLLLFLVKWIELILISLFVT